MTAGFSTIQTWIRLAILCGFMAAHSVAIAGPLIFKLHGKAHAELDGAAIQKKVPSQDVKVFEFHDESERVYRGAPFYELLRSVYGDKLDGAEEVVFTCLDGYQPSIPLSKIKGGDGFMATGFANGDSFKLKSKLNQNKEVDLGPYYLVWEDIKNLDLRADGPDDWPFQVASVDIVKFEERFRASAPPKSATAKAKAGFVAFRKHCQACHTVNGEGGGSTGIELNYPMSVTEYFKPTFLRKWIVSPQSVRADAGMPPFNMQLKNPDERIDSIIAYLEAMAKKKVKPLKP